LICLDANKEYILVVTILNESNNYMKNKNYIIFILKLFLNESSLQKEWAEQIENS